MRTALWLLIFGVMVSVSGVCAAASFSLVLSSDKNAYESGAEVRVKVSLTNRTTDAIGVRKAPGIANGDLSGFTVVVTDSHGDSAPETATPESGRNRDLLLVPY